MVQSYRRPLLISWPIGVGKSYNIDDVIEEAVKSDPYDLVLALFPTRRLIRERRWVKHPPEDVPIAILKPRPRKDCGRELNREWRSYETRGLGLLGREEIWKARCPTYGSCFWPMQYGKGLAEYRVIYGTQAHLERAPDFIAQIKSWTGAERILVLLDENNFVAKSFRHHLTQDELTQYLGAMKGLSSKKAMGEAHDRWVYLVELLIKDATTDLRSDQWRMPSFSPQWAVAVQRMGRTLFGADFRFLGYELRKFGWSRENSREKTDSGGVAFAIKPQLAIPGCDVIVYSGTAHPDFLTFRLGGLELANPFGDYRFEHPRTTWYNLASSLGTKGHFMGNAAQVLDFFAQLVARRMQEGRRVLLVAKKCFVEYCAAEMETRLRGLGLDVRVVKFGKGTRLKDPTIVPIINYGTVGTNRFTRFQCAYCLTGYYVNERVVNSILQDVYAEDFHIELKFTTDGLPRRRRVGVAKAADRFYDIGRLAQLALNQQEMDVVLQAVGRVRPYTKGREIFTFQCASHPKIVFTREFNSLAEARGHFGIVSTREAGKATTTALVQAAKKAGLTQQQAADKLKMGLRTVKRYWNR